MRSNCREGFRRGACAERIRDNMVHAPSRTRKIPFIEIHRRVTVRICDMYQRPSTTIYRREFSTKKNLTGNFISGPSAPR